MPGGAGGGVGSMGPGYGEYASFGDWWSGQPDWMQALFNSQLLQSAAGQATGIPGAGFAIGQGVDYLNEQYPSGVMHPDSPQNPNNIPQEQPDFFDPSWGLPEIPSDPRSPSTGNPIYATRYANRGMGGNLGPGGARMSPYNRTIWDSQNGGNLPMDSTEPGDRYAYDNPYIPPWLQER
jgi:hypothetical protein